MSDDQGGLFRAYINPLVFFGVEDPVSPDVPVPTAEQVLRHMATPGDDSSPATFQARCAELADAPEIIAAPDEPHVFTKLIWPLRHAKASYCVGNYIGTLALCGMVSEMVAITYFEGSTFRINGRDMDEKMQSKVWGKTFEGLGQERKIAILETYNILTPEAAKDLDFIRVKRNNYLHWASRPHDTIHEDARAVYSKTCDLVLNLMIKGYDDGKLVFNPLFQTFLARRGFVPGPKPE